jgi:hypothetical protein
MSFFNRNNIGISIGPNHLSVASAARRGGGIDIKQFAVEVLPEKICRPSPVEKNIIDLARWQSHVRSVLKNFPKTSKVKLSLPDSAARTLLLDLQQLPGDRKEFERLIQWHMEKSYLSSLGESRFSYQVLLRRTHWKVLATAVKKEVIDQYEGLDGGRSIEVQAVGLSSLYAFNLFRSLIRESVGESGHFIFAHLLDHSLAILIFEGGLLSFIRVKELTEQGGLPDAESGNPRDLIDIFLEEIAASLSFYDMAAKPASSLTHLFLSIDTSLPELGSRVEETFHLIPVLLDPYRLVRFVSGEDGELPEPAKRTIVSAAAAAIGE